jgi:hypothetical protein
MTAPSSYAADADEWLKDYRQRMQAAINRRPAPEGVPGELEHRQQLIIVPD